MMLPTSLPVAVACNRSMVDTDFRSDLRDFTTPTLLIHRDADTSTPLMLTGAKTAKLIANRTFKIYKGAPSMKSSMRSWHAHTKPSYLICCSGLAMRRSRKPTTTI